MGVVRQREVDGVVHLELDAAPDSSVQAPTGAQAVSPGGAHWHKYAGGWACVGTTDVAALFPVGEEPDDDDDDDDDAEVEVVNGVEVPTEEQVLARGYTPRAAVSISAKQAALASGMTEAEADEAAEAAAVARFGPPAEPEKPVEPSTPANETGAPEKPADTSEPEKPEPPKRSRRSSQK